jgi:hypothetical protein
MPTPRKIRQSPRIGSVVCPMPFSTLKPRANLDASNDAAFYLARFFQRTLFSSTANFIPDFGVWFSTTATSRGLIVRATKNPVPAFPRRGPILGDDLPAVDVNGEIATRGIL